MAGISEPDSSNDIQLILSEGRKLVMDGKESRLYYKEGGKIAISSGKTQLDEENETGYNQLIVPSGKRSFITFSDGTRVAVNANTRIVYPSEFSGHKREIYVNGEVYLQVSPDKKHPFVVKTNRMEVEVLGTEFNVSAYPADPDIVTTLAKGSVEIMMPEHTVKIVPDEQIVFNKEKNTFERVEVDAAVYSSWKDGNFIFENQSLGMIMERLRRWYEMEVFYTNAEVKEYRFTGDLRKYEDFEKVVRMIEEVAGVKIEINDKCVVIGTK